MNPLSVSNAASDWRDACSAMARALDVRMTMIRAETKGEGDESWMRDAEVRALAGFVYEADKPKAYFGGAVMPASVPLAQLMLQDFKDEEQLEIDINSPGGSALTGVALRNIFASAPQKIIMNVVGQASSAASLMLQGADVRNVDPGGQIGVHKAWIPTEGNAAQLEKTAAFLRGIDKSLIEIYAERVDAKDMGLLEKMMEVESTLTGADAVELGLADATRGRGSKARGRTPAAGAEVRARLEKMTAVRASAEDKPKDLASEEKDVKIEFRHEDKEVGEVEFTPPHRNPPPPEATTEDGQAINRSRRIAFC